MDELVIVNNLEQTRFQAVVDNNLALLDYQLRDGVLQIDYVYVPPDFRGRGIAGQLMEAALAHARQEGLRVHPVCSYARAYMARRI